MSTSQQNEFPVGWDTFDPKMKKPDGSVLIVVVDDYTVYCLWDKLLVVGIPRIGSRPQGMVGRHQKLPEGDWVMVNAIRTMATNDLYAKVGITKPSFDQLPAVYAIKHGELTGHYVFNAEADRAIEFIRMHI